MHDADFEDLLDMEDFFTERTVKAMTDTGGKAMAMCAAG